MLALAARLREPAETDLLLLLLLAHDCLHNLTMGGGNWVGSELPMEASTRHALECKANPILADKHVRSAKALGDRSLILPFFVASSCLLRLNAQFEVADIIAGMRMHAACTSLRTSVFDGSGDTGNTRCHDNF